LKKWGSGVFTTNAIPNNAFNDGGVGIPNNVFEQNDIFEITATATPTEFSLGLDTLFYLMG
jgi:hypothetical protein